MVSPTTKAKRAARQPLRNFARTMRHVPTDAEAKFWRAVRGRQFGGYKFKRQYLVGSYIVDFVCLEGHLVVELDGGQHGSQEDYDAQRTTYLNGQGFRVLRYWNDEFLRNPDVVLEDIARALEAPSPASCARGLSPRGGEAI